MEWSALGEDARQTNRALVRSIADILAIAGKSIRRNRIVRGAVSQTGPGEHPVLLADPADAQTARRAAQENGAHIWGVLHADMTPAQMEAAETALGPAFEAWVDERAVADRLA